MPKRAYLSLGSNLGDRLAHLRSGIAFLAECPGIAELRKSPVYESDPVGVVDQPAFLNAVVEVLTTLDPEELLDVCLAAEAAEGRIRGRRWGPRVLDVDVLLYEDRVMHTDRLILPHPRLRERAFVLQPLVDLAPSLRVSAEATAAEALALVAPGGLRLVHPADW